MELTSNPLNSSSSWKKQWRRRKYRRVDSDVASRKNIKVVRFGGKVKRVWRIRAIPKLRFVKFASPLKLWKNFKNAYMNMMLGLAGNVGALNNGNVFGGKRIPKARQVSLEYNKTQFENRLIYEIYKSLVVSMELNPR